MSEYMKTDQNGTQKGLYAACRNFSSAAHIPKHTTEGKDGSTDPLIEIQYTTLLHRIKHISCMAPSNEGLGRFGSYALFFSYLPFLKCALRI